jgi:hypothetical protein
MSLETKNPFTLNNYIIAESSIYDCANLKNTSKIVMIGSDMQTYISQGYILSNKMNLMEVNKYLTKEMNKFLAMINLAKTCSMYIMQDNDSSKKCKNTFNNFAIDRMQFGAGNNVLDNFTYTEDYIKKKKTDNNKKHLCQRLADLRSLIDDYNKILTTMNTGDIKSKYLDQYSSIMEQHKKNIKVRQELEQKLDFIYSTDTRFGNSKHFLDSTIYTSVLWTILATTILFYIFKKM